MSPDMFLASLTLGIMLSFVGATFTIKKWLDDNREWKPWLVLLPLLFGWWIVPWLFYLASTLPWDMLRKTFPPISTTSGQVES